MRSSDVVLDRLSRHHPKVIDLVLDRVERLLGRLGNPERRLPPVVHVAGTNGKGSVLAFLRAMLEAAGYRVHVYTSPHLARFHERIRLAGNLITEADLLAVLDECERANGSEPITFFEITTAAAFLAFTRVPADVVLLETGLGGRLDATNVIARPHLTAITPIALDHRDYLGDTIDLIAGEKAGILKPGVPCVIARQTPQADAVIEARADAMGAPLIRQGRDWDCETGGTGMQFRWHADTGDLPLPALAGTHQVGNAGQAVACIRTLDGFDVAAEAVAKGLREVTWPGRLQRLRQGPLVSAVPADWEVWLDGAHNVHAAQALARQAEGWRDKPLHLVIGMLGNRDPRAFLEPLSPFVGQVRAVPAPSTNAGRDPATIAAAAAALGLPAATATHAEAAIRDIVAAAPDKARVLVCGTLYLAGSLVAEGNC